MNRRVFVDFKRASFLLIFIPMMIQAAEPTSEEWRGFWLPAKKCVEKSEESNSSESPKTEESKHFSLLGGTLQVTGWIFSIHI